MFQLPMFLPITLLLRLIFTIIKAARKIRHIDIMYPFAMRSNVPSFLSFEIAVVNTAIEELHVYVVDVGFVGF